jgi:hypothetical protein
MRTFLIVVVLLIVGWFVVSAVQEGSSGHQSAGESAQSDSAAESALQVSALKLFTDYQGNEVAADNVYKGRSLAVSGIVRSINKDMFDHIYLALISPNEFMDVQAHLSEGNETKAASLQAGEAVTVICTGAGMVVGTPMLDKCSFASEPIARQSAANPPLWPNGSASESSPQAVSVEPTPQQDAAPDANGIYKIGGAVSAPIVTNQVEPEMPEQARIAKMGAKVLVNLDVDASGNPANVHAERVILVNSNGNASSGPLNGGSADTFGFDEKAVEAVKQYRFTPSKLNGVGVPVELNVEVTFQIF